MDPIPDDRIPLKMTADEARELLGMNHNRVLNWCPNAFRAGPWDPGLDNDHPWRHKDVKAFLRNLGYGRFCPMPVIYNDDQATAEGDRWRGEVYDAYVEYVRLARVGMDLMLHMLDQQDLLPDDELETLLRDAWASVSQSAMYVSDFGCCALSEDAAQGYRFYLQHYRGIELVRDFGPGSNDMNLSVPRTIFDVKLTKPKVQAEILAPQRLALQVPALNLTSLKQRGVLAVFLTRRFFSTPDAFAMPDWEASHIGRSSRLLVPPYCDARFMVFPSRKMTYFDVGYDKRLRSALKIPVLSPSEWGPYNIGRHWYGCDIKNPSASEAVNPVFKDLRRMGRVFGWGDGILVLQSQSLILRYLHAVGLSLLRKQATSGSFPDKRLEPLTEEELKLDPVFVDYQRPPTLEIPEPDATVPVLGFHDYVNQLPESLNKLESRTVFQATCHVPVHMSEEGSPCRDQASTLSRHVREVVRSTLTFKRIVREHFGCHYGHVPEVHVKSNNNNSNKDKKKGGKSKEARDPQPQGQVDYPTGDGDSEIRERTERQLPHLHSTDLTAKSRLVDDVLRRAIMMLICSVEMPSVLEQLRHKAHEESVKWDTPFENWVDPLPTFPRPLQDAVVRLVFHVRWFQDIVLMILLHRGVFHGSSSVRDYFERSPSNEALRAMVTGNRDKGPWALPRGFAHFDRLGKLDFRIAKQHQDGAVAQMHRIMDMLANGHLHRFVHLHIIAEEFGLTCEKLWERDWGSSYVSYPIALLAFLLANLCRMNREFSLSAPFDKWVDEIRADPVKLRRMQESTNFGRFILNHDDFAFERHVDPSACRDVRWILGVRYANDPRTFISAGEGKSRMDRFWTGILNWVCQLGRNSPRYFCEALGEGLTKPEEEDEKNEEFPAKGRGILLITSDGCGPISTLHPQWGPLGPSADDQAAAGKPNTPSKPAMEDVVQANKKWILNRYRDSPPQPFDLKNAGEKVGSAGGQPSENATKPSRFSFEDWETIEMTFGGQKGQTRWHDWLRVVTGLGFSTEPVGGSAFKFSWTESSLIPKEKLGSTSVVLHAQHGKDTSVSLRRTKVREFVNMFETILHINLRVIMRHYGPNPLRQDTVLTVGAAQAKPATVVSDEEWESSEDEVTNSSDDSLAGDFDDEDADGETGSEPEETRSVQKRVRSETEQARPAKRTRFS